MQKRKPGRPHKGWKAAARKSRSKPIFDRRKFASDLGKATLAAQSQGGLNLDFDKIAEEVGRHIRKGHTPWNDPDHHRASDDGIPDHDAGVPSNANEVLHGSWRAAMTEAKPTGSADEPDAKMRERLTECFTLLAKAIEKAAAIIVAGHEVPEPPVERPEFTWNLVGPGTPLGAWLETKITRNTLVAELNVCMCRIASIGDVPEWIEKEGGRTTVTHSTFAAPTHWRWPVS